MYHHKEVFCNYCYALGDIFRKVIFRVLHYSVRLTGLIKSCVSTAFWNMLLKELRKER